MPPEWSCAHNVTPLILSPWTTVPTAGYSIVSEAMRFSPPPAATLSAVSLIALIHPPPRSCTLVCLTHSCRKLYASTSPRYQPCRPSRAPWYYAHLRSRGKACAKHNSMGIPLKSVLVLGVVSLDSSTMTDSCRFGISANNGDLNIVCLAWV